MKQGEMTRSVRLFWKKELLSLLFLSLGLILADLVFTSFFTVVAFMLVLLKWRRIPFSMDGELVFLLLTSFFIFNSELLVQNDSLVWCLFFSVTPVLMYFLGKYYTSRWKGESVFLFVMLILSVTLAMVNYYFTLKNISVCGLINPMRDLTVVPEAMNKPITIRTVELSLSCFGFTLIWFSPDDRAQKIGKFIFIVMASLSTLCFVHYVSRTGIVFVMVSLIVGLCVLRRNIKGKTKFIISIVVVLLLLVYKSVFKELFELYQQREEVVGYDAATAGGRTERWASAINGMIDNPMGYSTDFLAHNFWLGIGQSFGILPFIFLSMFSMLNITKSYKIVKRKGVPLLTRVGVASFTMLFFLANFTECVHNGSVMYMLVYFMFCGMVSSFYNSLNYETSIYQ